MWTTLFYPFYDLAKAFDKVQRTIIIFDVILLDSSYILFFELFFQELNKLLHALMTFDKQSEVLISSWSAWCSM